MTEITDSSRLDKLAAYLTDPSKNIGGPDLARGDSSWQFGYNAGPCYVVEGSGETLRDAIDSLP